jgi:hypothetical protein
MDLSNTPPPFDWNKSQQVETAQSPSFDDSSFDRRLFLESLEASKEDSSRTPAKGIAVENQGQIKMMNLPGNWQETIAKSDSNVLRSERFFHPGLEPEGSKVGVDKDSKISNRAGDSKDTRLVYFYSGRPNSEADGNQLRQTLQADPHKLSNEEIKQLGKTLGDLGDPESFKLTDARTRDLNGKRVLDVKGIWLYDNKQYHGVLINGDGSGQVVQQIYLMSPEHSFSKYDAQFEAACRSIKWR